MNYLELFGAISGLIYIFLEVKQKSVMWIVGFITSIVYIIVFFQSKFYAGMALNAYYLFISVYGWYQWRYGGQSGEQKSERKVTHVTFPTAIVVAVVAILLFVLISQVLVRYTDSPVPYYDALASSLSIVATWMLARKLLQHWILWIFINFFSVALYYWRGLYPTSVLYLVYGVMSIVGWIQWKSSYDN